MAETPEFPDLVRVESRKVDALEAEVMALEEQLNQKRAQLEIVKAGFAAMIGGKQDKRRTGKKFAAKGFIVEVLDFLKAHPNQEFTPGVISAELGQPERNILAASVLKRLVSRGLINKPKTGHYVFRASALPTPSPKTKRRKP
jgi:hypothetical protein